MAKKIAFLLMLVVGLALASVTASAGTDNGTTALNTGLTNDKVASADKTVTHVVLNNTAVTSADSAVVASTSSAEKSGKDYEQYISKYLDPSAEKTDNFLVSIKWNQKDPVNNPLLYVLTGTVKKDSENGSPLIVMLYIKADDVYIPLVCSDGSNIIEVSGVAFASRTDLLYLGSDKVNHIRIIAFRKDDIDKLVPGVNLQITDKLIIAKKTVIVPVPVNVDSVLDALKVK